ncbi:DNA polymerase II large subunit [Nanobdella aerobiophila]|uniref:DNA polymerase II large subunit n=1 Tax=Nanobdella aerobiophila TaxID=2586965 RepID=A0A915WRM3_9ARCH|nr:DNA polymerase II large subunit [Nanobdella aerobiophila]BBL45399.1 DNA polymerase II large subunit [Nanobdella aerobiophila]
MNDMDQYFSDIRKKTLEAYELAKKARLLKLDSTDDVEIPISEDMSERIVNLLSNIDPIIKEINLPEKIREIEKQYKALSFATILKIADYVSEQIYNKTKDKLRAIDLGIRSAFTYHTLGVVAASTEGIIKVISKKRRDNKEYLSIYYAGPVRSAGGTPQAFSVVVADLLRKKFGYEKWDPDNDEVQRYVIEVYDYKRMAHLQYTPKKEELEFVLQNLPIEINGEATLESEVSGYKDLPRIETNFIRGGAMLVLAEGICQKAGKIWKKLEPVAKDFNLEDWKWLSDYKKLQERIYSSSSDSGEKIKPNSKYLAQLTAGRPIFSLPSAKGGFRLRYGKSRTNGHEASSIHPAAAALTYNFLAWGTQIAVERPGKASAVTFSDTIEPPVVKLKDGSVKKIYSEKIAKELIDKNLVEKILFLGDILFTYGDFLDNGHILVPVGYCEEWWVLEFEKNAKEKLKDFEVVFDMLKPRKMFEIKNLDKLSDYLNIDKSKLEGYIRDPLRIKPDLIDSLKISLLLDVPLHPLYTYFWKDISADDIIYLLNYIKDNSKIDIEKIKIGDKEVNIARRIEINYDENVKRILEEILIEHNLENNKIIINYPDSAAFYLQVGYINDIPSKGAENNGYEIISRVSVLKIRDKVGTYIGLRMGRPEKARIRELTGSIVVLFPVGKEGGRMRNLMESRNYGKILADLKLYYCPNCKIYVPYRKCIFCKSDTKLLNTEDNKTHKVYNIDIGKYIEAALKNLNMDSSQVPKIIKGPEGLSSKDKEPERLEKGILRAKYGVFVFRDGTTRFDAIEVPITYFKPKDLLFTPIEKLKELGYTRDIYGNPLENEEQILELKPQDIILPIVGPYKKAGKIKMDGFLRSLINTTRFLDEELERLYNLPKYYNVDRPEDLLGHLLIVLAPHTSAGVVGRIIGFSKTQALLMHPLMHAGIRRNCDGDEGGFILLLDALINFSKNYLPEKRGGMMDAPLTITLKLKGMEVDDEVHNFDTVWNYPLELYYNGLEYRPADSIKIQIYKDRLNKEDEYTNWGFMHDIDSISNEGNTESAYKFLGEMLEKLNFELKLSRLLRSVDPVVVANLVINLHFARDIKGNLRKFSEQEFRCIKCNTKYRRIPLSGKCIRCNGKIVMTVTYGSVIKYLEPSLWLSENLHLDEYTSSSLRALKEKIDETFGNVSKERKLKDFFNI